MVRISRVLIAVAAAGLLASACTVKKTERPALTGPSELALSLNVTASPDILTQDGSSQSRIVVMARDHNGDAVKGLPLHIDMQTAVSGCSGSAVPTWCASAIEIAASGQLSSTDMTTGTDGRAALTYTAPPAPFERVDTLVTIQAIPVATDYANSVPRAVNVRLIPPGVLPAQPVAAFSVSPLAPITGSSVGFDATASSSAGGAVVAWLWDFGDGTTGSGAKVQHTFRQSGDYSVALVVRDEQGRSSNAFTQTVRVADAAPPTAAFVFSPGEPAVDQSIFFNATASTPGSGRTLVRWDWDFGNGSYLSGLTVSTTYSTAGKYTVTLVVTDDLGHTKSTSADVTVK